MLILQAKADKYHADPGRGHQDDLTVHCKYIFRSIGNHFRVSKVVLFVLVLTTYEHTG